MFSVIMLWAASVDGHLSSLVACHCTDLYLFNLFVHLANKLSLSIDHLNTVSVGLIIYRFVVQSFAMLCAVRWIHVYGTCTYVV